MVQGERGIIEKDLSEGKIRVAIVYPGTYKEAMASLGYMIIHSVLNEQEDIVAHRFTLDSPFSIEAGLGLKNYDMIVASVHFDLQLPLLLKYIAAQRIPLRREERNIPVLVGGPGVWNPLPSSVFADGIFIGEGEDHVAEAVRAVYENRREAQAPGLFNSWIKNRTAFQRHDLSYRPPATVVERSAYGRRAIYVESSRGCNFGCRFCMIGWTQRPRRDRRVSQILDWIAEGMENGGEKVFFYASDVLGHPHMKKILETLSELHIPFSLASMRMDRLDDEMFEILRRNGTKTITVALETASPRLKPVINKMIPNDEVIELARQAKRFGIRRIKIYQIIGLPGEEPEDVLAIKHVVSELRKLGINAEISANALIPKPYTPFQWAAFPGIEYTQSLNKVLRRELHADTMNPKRAFIQTLLSIGDGRVGEVLLRAYKDLNYSHWMDAIRKVELDVDAYMREERATPWMNVIDTGVNPDFLRGEWEKAKRGEPTPPCHEKCSLCGVCFP